MTCKHLGNCCAAVFAGLRLPCEVIHTQAFVMRENGDGDRSVVAWASVIRVEEVEYA